jgi:hypothetical protein
MFPTGTPARHPSLPTRPRRDGEPVPRWQTYSSRPVGEKGWQQIISRTEDRIHVRHHGPGRARAYRFRAADLELLEKAIAMCRQRVDGAGYIRSVGRIEFEFIDGSIAVAARSGGDEPAVLFKLTTNGKDRGHVKLVGAEIAALEQAITDFRNAQGVTK